jgi:molybdopterin converting factor subunit 1
VTIAYYATLREQRGCSEEQVETAAQTAEDLYHEIANRHKLTSSMAQLRVAINDAYVSWDTALNEGDTVVFIPPVAGG